MKLSDVRLDIVNLLLCCLCNEKVGFTNTSFDQDVICPECADEMTNVMIEKLESKEVLNVIYDRYRIKNNSVKQVLGIT
ncbi:MAG: hypothetical protein ACE5IR_11795 [bacterium]